MEPRELSRRGVLRAGGILLTGAALRADPVGRQVLAAYATPPPQPGHPPVHTGTLAVGTSIERVRRGADLLVADFVLIGLSTVVRANVAYLTAPGKSGGHLAVVLPGQAIGEGFLTSTEENAKKNVPHQLAELAQPTVLIFGVPHGRSIRRDLAGLLDWLNLPAVWGAVGQVRARLEVPYRLTLTPASYLSWTHSAVPVSFRQADGAITTELWHTRLTKTRHATPAAGSKETKPQSLVQLVANEEDHVGRVASVKAGLGTKLKLPLDDVDRAQIAKQAPGFQSVKGLAPVRVDRLHLSALGATAALAGRWPDYDPKAQDKHALRAWDHRLALGRDAYVRTVRSGFLLPYGHRASLITVTRRRMDTRTGEGVAVLVQSQVVVLQEEIVDTRGAASIATGGGRTFPFTSVRCTVAISPELPPPVTQSTQFRLPFVGTDWVGSETHFTSPVSFLSENQDKQGEGYLSSLGVLVSVDLGGHSVAVATGPGGATVAPISVMEVGIEYTRTTDGRAAHFVPDTKSLVAQVPALEALGAAVGPVRHIYADEFRNGLTNAIGLVLTAMAAPSTTGVALTAPGSLSGGVADLPQTYLGLSTGKGAVIASDATALAQLTTTGVASAASIFGSLSLLGGIPLSSLVAPAHASLAPQVTVTDGPDGPVSTLTMTPQLNAGVTTSGVLKVQPEPDASLTVSARRVAGGQSLDAHLTNVKLQIDDLIAIELAALRVTSATGAPLDVELVTGDIGLLGALGFVQPIVEVLGPLLQSTASATSFAGAAPQTPDGEAHPALTAPDVQVSPGGITVSESLGIPDVGIGLFTLSGVAFSLLLSLPFGAPVSLTFAFASRDNPFQVTYGPFGGGGYVQLGVGASGPEAVEVSIDAAGAVGVNLGVASGGISIAAGFTLARSATMPTTYTAFARASGCLNVLGLVSLSMVFEIDLSMTDGTPRQLTGTATVHLTIKVLFIHKSVHASISRTYDGGIPGPKLIAGSARGGPEGESPDGTRTATFGDTFPVDGSADPHRRSGSSSFDAYCSAFHPVS